MALANTLPASVQRKKGRLYAVIQTKENGKSKPVWRSLGLPEGSNKSKVNKAFRAVVKQFEEEYAERQARGNRPAADIPIFEYMCGFLKKIQPDLQKNTVESYHSMIYGKIQRYFSARSH